MTPSTVRLKQLAEAATPGWSNPVPGFIRTENGKGYGFSLAYNDAEYCVAANPEAVLGLISRIEKLEAALQFYADEDHWSYANSQTCPAIIMGEDIVNRNGNVSRFTGGLVAREALKEET